jgi:hypothetical protein
MFCGFLQDICSRQPQMQDLRRITLIDQDILAVEYGTPETSINDPIVQKPTTNSLYCFLSTPLPLSVCFPRRLSSLSVSSAYPSRLLSLSLCGEREFERFEDDEEEDDDLEDVCADVLRRSAICSICGSRAGTGPSPLSTRSSPLARIISSRRGWKKYYESNRQREYAKSSAASRT